MQLVIKNGKVHAWHEDNQDIFDAYPEPEFEIFQWAGPQTSFSHRDGEQDDPRTQEQKSIDAEQRYLRKRRQFSPTIRQCLDLIFRDMRDGTTQYVDAIQAIHDRHLKPVKET